MSELRENIRYRRSIDLENAAIENILSMYLNSGGVINLSPKKIMVSILTIMRDACIVSKTAKESKTNKEHLMLLHTNEFLDSVITELKSRQPSSIEIFGNTYQDCIGNLEKIKRVALKNENSDEIIERLDFFINGLNNRVDQMIKADKEQNAKAIVKSIIVGFVVIAFILFAFYEPSINGEYQPSIRFSSISIAILAGISVSCISYAKLFRRP